MYKQSSGQGGQKMAISEIELGQLITIIMIALALGMDAFSLGISLGLRGLSQRNMWILSLLVGFFHVLLPLIGMGIGYFLGKYIREIAVLVGGGMLCYLGINMLWNSLKTHQEQLQIIVYSISSIFLFALSVSIDSLSAGVSWGLFAQDQWIALLFFGISGIIMSAIGLGLGKYMGTWLDGYGEIIGGVILLVLGIKFIMI
jgi:putative Mn2+ efflux pump MntP